jgi:hypothetical protein
MIFDARRRFGSNDQDPSVDIEFGRGGAALQRDAGSPGLEWCAGAFNRWRGVHGRGSGQPTLDGAQFGVSGVLRKFKVIAFSNNRGDITQATDVAEAGDNGLSFDALIPVIPASDLENRSIALTFTASYVKVKGSPTSTGGLTGGMQFLPLRALADRAPASTPATSTGPCPIPDYDRDRDPGRASRDRLGIANGRRSALFAARNEARHHGELRPRKVGQHRHSEGDPAHVQGLGVLRRERVHRRNPCRLLR